MTVAVAGNPDLGNGADFIVSALVKPLDGVKVSGGYALKGNSVAGGFLAAGDGAWNVAADVDVAKLIDADFSLGVSAAYVGAKVANGPATSFVAALYGGIDVVDAGLEYAFVKADSSAELQNIITVVANVNVVENLGLTPYFGIKDLSKPGDTWFLGLDASYTVSSVTFGVGLAYDSNAITGAGTDELNYNKEGFTIVPSVKVAF